MFNMVGGRTRTHPRGFNGWDLDGSGDDTSGEGLGTSTGNGVHHETMPEAGA
jgi:hypothetical protein